MMLSRNRTTVHQRRGGSRVAYDKELAERVKEVLDEHPDVDERKMFGGITFMVRGHMCCGVLNDDLVLRLDPGKAAALLKSKHVRLMDFTGRPMKGFVVIKSIGVRTEAMLRRRIQSALDFVETLPSK
jgi:TfoX/Sxy family transcriptional regulator of competence genes